MVENGIGIMHYHPSSFAAKKHHVVIKARRKRWQSCIGRGNHGSMLDYLKINILYKCEGVEEMVEKLRDGMQPNGSNRE